MKKAAQNQFFKKRVGTDHGGDAVRGSRKVARPLATKRPMHIVLRSSLAVKDKSFLRRKNRHLVEAILETLAARYGIRVMKFQNVGNHLHLLIQGKCRVLLQKFLRAFPSKVALAITGAKRGNPVGRFFDSIFFSRVVEWGRDIRRLKNYFFKNELEASGLPPEDIERWKEFAKTLPT